MSKYKQTAKDAVDLLKEYDSLSSREYDPRLAAEFLISSAVLSSSKKSREVDLAAAIEFLDFRQHVGLTAREVSCLISSLTERGILEIKDGPRVFFTDRGWDSLPRQRSKSLAISKRDKNRWLSLVTKKN